MLCLILIATGARIRKRAVNDHPHKTLRPRRVAISILLLLPGICRSIMKSTNPNAFPRNRWQCQSRRFFPIGQFHCMPYGTPHRLGLERRVFWRGFRGVMLLVVCISPYMGVALTISHTLVSNAYLEITNGGNPCGCNQRAVSVCDYVSCSHIAPPSVNNG